MSLFAPPWGNYLLKDIVETSFPAAISWWPATIGWQFVLLLILIFIIRKSYLAIKHYQKNIYRRDALLCLTQIMKVNKLASEPVTAVNQHNYQKLPALLRSTALHAYARTEISLLNGQAWELWLDEQCDNSDFSGKCTGVLDKLAYQPNFCLNDNQIAQLATAIELWVKGHRSSND